MYNENNADALNYKYPTLVDMVGFQNANDVNTRGNLGFVFNGCIEEGTRLNIDAPNQRYLITTLFCILFIRLTYFKPTTQYFRF